MRKLRVLIFSDNKEIGKAYYLDIIVNQKVELLSFKLHNLHLSKGLRKGDFIVLRIVLDQYKFDDWKVILKQDISSENNVEFLASLKEESISLWESYYVDVYRIYSDWKNNKSIDWRDFKYNIRGKIAWTISCFRTSGISSIIQNGMTYILDGNEVDDDLDFYCLLGEAFFGYKGYFGGDGNGMLDCLNSISVNNPNHKSRIVFKNVDKFEKAFSAFDTRYFENIVMKDFSDNGFLVETPTGTKYD